MSQKDLILSIAQIVRGISGIREAPDYPPEQMADFPFAVVYPGDGRHMGHALAGAVGLKKWVGSVIVEIHVGRRDLPSTVASLLDFADSVPNALLADPTLGGKCDTFGEIKQSFGELGWGDTPTIGFRFVISDIKIVSDL
jgi:hypothetical protein